MALRATVDAGAGGTLVTSVSGTAFEVTATPTTGAVVVGLAAIAKISTSLAIGGATIGSNALAVTGTTSLANGAFTVDATGHVLIGGGGNLIIPSAQFFQFNNRTAIYSSADGNLNIQNNAGTVSTFISTPVSATLHLGAADAASPVAQTLGVQGVVAGTSNTAGANWTIAGSVGTGTGAGGSLIFQTAPAGSTGTAQNTLTTALTIDSTQKSTFAGQLIVNIGGSTSNLDPNDKAYFTGAAYAQFHLFASTSSVAGYVTANSNGSAAWSGGLTTPGMNLFTSSAHPIRFATNNIQVLSLGAQTSQAAWTTSGVGLVQPALSWTDTSSSGTVAAAYTNLFGASTILASSATTYTNYYGTYFTDPVASTNVTMTAKWALGADSAKIGGVTFATGATGNLTAGGNILSGNGYLIGASGRGGFLMPNDGNMELVNNAQADFGRLMFGGTTSSFPALKRSTTSLQGRLADDSAFAVIQAKLTTDTNATTGLTAGVLAATTNASIVLYDASGQAYRIPCII